MSDLHLNQFSIEINHQLINDDFFIVKIFRNRGYLSYKDLYFIDSLKDNADHKVLSVCFDFGKEAFAIYDAQAFSNFDEILNKIPTQDELLFEKISSDELKEEKLLQLFLNACSSSENSRYRINNLTGKLFINIPEKAFYNRKDQSRMALQIKVLPDNHIKLDTVTFTSLARYNDLIKNKYGIECKKMKRKLRDEPTFVFESSTSSFRRLIETEEIKVADKYVKRRVPERYRKGKKKNSIDFFSLNPKKYPATKIALLNDLLFEKFEPRFGNYIQINQNSLPEQKETKTKKSISATEVILNELPIRLIDNVEDEKQLNEIKRIIIEELGIKVVLAKKCDNDYLNLQFNQDRTFYTLDKTSDPYKKSSLECAVQNFTLQEFKEKGKNQLLKTISEGHIKFDIVQQQLSIFDWKKLGLEEDWYFALADEQKDVIDFHFLKISPDGKLDFSTHSRDTFNEASHRKIGDAFLNPRGKVHYQLEGVILGENGQINRILRTNIQTFPNLRKTHFEIMKGVDIENKTKPANELRRFTKKFLKSFVGNEQLVELNNWLHSLPKEHPVLLSELKNRIKGKQKVNIQFAEAFKTQFGFWLKYPFKNKEVVSNTFASMVDVHAIRNDGGILFWANKNMGRSKGEFTKTNIIRKLNHYRGDDSLFEPLLETMSVDFVRVDAPSVIPFPFKILREYMLLNNNSNSYNPILQFDNINFDV